MLNTHAPRRCAQKDDVIINLISFHLLKWYWIREYRWGVFFGSHILDCRGPVQRIPQTVPQLLYNWNMPHTPPIARRKNKALLNDKRFFKLLSEQCNFMDETVVANLYMGVVRVVARELRANKIARLPHICDVALVRQRPRVGWTGKRQVYMDAQDVLKAYPTEGLRRYFRKRKSLT